MEGTIYGNKDRVKSVVCDNDSQCTGVRMFVC